VATLAIFTPSALLITLLADVIGAGSKKHWQPIIAGIKPVVIGLMTYSIWILMLGFDNYYFPVIGGIIAAFIIIRFQVHFLWLILVSGIFGIWFFGA
jgi:chromate transport protein ChrA